MYLKNQIKIKNSLLSLGMLTYTCERPNIIQIALKGLSGGAERRCRKKNFVRFSPLFTC
jgi:hypothetical protein